MRRRAVLITATAIAVLLVTPAWAATEVAYVEAPRWQIQPSAGTAGYVVIGSDEVKAGWFNTYASDGGPRVKVNRPKTESYGGGVEGDDLLYQEVKGSGSDLFFFDLPSETRSDPPVKVNTRNWEWGPTFSGDWALFGRNNTNTGAKRKWQKIMLVNLQTAEVRTLAKSGTKPYLAAGQVNGDYAVWEKCTGGGGCDVYRHQISTTTTTTVPNPGALQYSPSVASNGTMFFARATDGCGAGTQIVRRTAGGVETVFHTFPSNRDMYDSFAATNPSVQTDLFYSRYNCPKATTDIYYIASALTAAPQAARPAGRQGSGSESMSWLVAPGSAPGR